MEELKNQIEKEATALMESKAGINNLLDQKVNETQDVKTAIDILATKTALEQKETLEKVVVEKEEELRNDAEAKRIQAETQRIEKEVEKVKQEKEKEIAEIDKVISAKQKEVEQLKAESDKAQAFFDSNEDILSYVGVRSKKTLRVMYMLMIPAIIVFALVQIIALPITIVGKLLELIINIVAGVCKTITNNALKILISVLVVAVLLGGGFCAYYFSGKIFW